MATYNITGNSELVLQEIQGISQFSPNF